MDTLFSGWLIHYCDVILMLVCNVLCLSRGGPLQLAPGLFSLSLFYWQQNVQAYLYFAQPWNQTCLQGGFIPLSGDRTVTENKLSHWEGPGIIFVVFQTNKHHEANWEETSDKLKLRVFQQTRGLHTSEMLMLRKAEETRLKEHENIQYVMLV